jgi:WD40 repeat protein/serine/threonine protein kinase
METMMDSSPSRTDPLNALAEEFLTRYRRGERPALSEYAAQHPELAERIRELFPTLILMEQCGPPSVEAPALQPGLPRQWGEYRLLREVGRGGMGIVYEAVQEALGRRVAIKVLPPALQHGKHRERFQREGRAAARLHHTNIVPLFGVGEHEGMLFLVMQFIDGRGLDVILREFHAGRGTARASGNTHPVVPEERAGDIRSETPLTGFATDDPTPPVAAWDSTRPPPLSWPHEEMFFHAMTRLGAQAAEALAYAHSQGVLHRDIKPSNLLVDGQGTLWVADFGLAKTGDSATLTERSEVVGTLRYLAPERFRGQCDARSDVYTLGVTLYEMLTLRPAFEGDERVELIERIMREAPPRPRLVLPSIPLDLETIVLKAMAKEPAERYASAAELAGDLRCYLEDRPIRARRPTLRQKLARWSRRHKPILWSAAVSTFVLLLLSVAVLAWSNFVISHERDQKDAALSAAQESELMARRRFYAGQIFLAHQAWQAGNPARVLDLLEELRPGPNEVDLRSFEWYYLWRLCHQGQRFTRNVPNSRSLCLVFSPDGKTLAVGGSDSSIRLWEAATGRPLARWTGEQYKVPCLAFAPDGKTLVAPNLRQPHNVTRWNLATGQSEDILKDLRGTVQSMAFSSDRKTLAIGEDDGTITLWDTTTWREPITLRKGGGLVTSLVFSPDGRKLAAATPWGPDNGRIQIWDLANRPSCVSWKFEEAYSLAFSPDGRKLAAGGTFGFLRLFEAATGQPCASFHGHSRGNVFSVAFTPDGKTLASGGNDRTVRLWDVDTAQPRYCYADSGPVYAVAFSPDGQMLVSAGHEGTITFRDAVPAQEELVLPDAGGFVAFSPDGKTLASAGKETLKLWDVATWKATTLSFGGGTEPSESLAFSHDGKTLAVARGRTLKLFDVLSRQEQASHERPTICWSVAFSPDDKTLASARIGAPGISLWDLATQKVRDTLTPDPTSQARIAAFSPDGKTLATGGGYGVLKLFDLATGQEPVTLQAADRGGIGWLFCVAFSPDGHLLASGDMRGNVKLWDVATGKWRATFKGQVDAVLALTFTSDGRTLVTGGDDQSVKLWDVATGQERITLKGFKSAVRSLAFAPNDTLLVAGSSDGTVRVWRAAADPEAPTRRAEPSVEK